MGSTEPTAPLSVEASREIEEEMRRPPADTPGRRRMSELLREMAEWWKRHEGHDLRAGK
jgi:hypothetical protein